MTLSGSRGSNVGTALRLSLYCRLWRHGDRRHLAWAGASTVAFTLRRLRRRKYGWAHGEVSANGQRSVLRAGDV